jgi:hypothetical protein
VRRNPARALSAASLVALASATGWIVWKSELFRQPLTTGIAVLPFENLGDEKEHPAFADGVKEDILTKLAKIADLKVISRTSVMAHLPSSLNYGWLRLHPEWDNRRGDPRFEKLVASLAPK